MHPLNLLIDNVFHTIGVNQERGTDGMQDKDPTREEQREGPDGDEGHRVWLRAW